MLALFIPIDLYHLYHAALSEVLCANFVDWAKEISARLFDDHSVTRSVSATGWAIQGLKNRQ
jgi:hypothetical protein